jgi:four helix bundle protein
MITTPSTHSTVAPASDAAPSPEAGLSVVLNIAEGAGQRSRAQKRHIYSIARGSAMESAAILDVLRRRGVASVAEARTARALAVHVVQMLTKLDQALA